MADHLCDYIVKISPSDQLKKFLKEYLQEVHEEVSFDTIRKVHSILKKDNHDIRLHQLLNGSEIILPKPPLLPRNKELEARIEKLKQQHEEQEYLKMTKSVDVVYRSRNVQEFRTDVRIMQSHTAAAFNFVITVGACFLFGYKVIDFLLSTEPNMASKVLCGLLCGGIGAIADLYFLIKHLDA